MKPTGKLPYLNLGCGYTFHTDWTNVDFISNSPHVIAHNLLQGIPFDDSAFEVVYHSHVLEHFSRQDAKQFLVECHRVLRKGGLLRVAVPDLEQIAFNYLKYLNESIEGIPGADFRYQWSLMEMYDQVVRIKSGGEMAAFLQDVTPAERAFLIERNGKEVEEILDGIEEKKVGNEKRNYSFSERLRSLPQSLKHRILKLMMGEEYMIYHTGKFRAMGEIHQWMYDRYSLKKILEEIGFGEVKMKDKFESSIAQWESFKLDGDGGQLRKPDSLFMEARKH